MTGKNRSGWALALLLNLISSIASSDTNDSHNHRLRLIYPVIVRIAPGALNSSLAKKVEHWAPVSNVVVGVRAVGRSHTNGTTSFRLVDNGNDDFLVVEFQGQTLSRSVGRSGPVRIESRSETQFRCTRQIRFDVNRGLVAAPSEVTSQTTLVYDQVASTRRGIGSRLVSRVAQRRAADLHEQARREIAQSQRAQLIQEFDKRINEELASLNRTIWMVRYASGLWNASDPLPIATFVTSDGLQLGLGVPRSSSGSEFLKPATGQAPAEIWVHSSAFGGLLTAISPLVKQRSAWDAIASRFQLETNSTASSVDNVWIRAAWGSSGESLQVARDSGSDGYVFVMNQLAGIPHEIEAALCPAPPPASEPEVIELSWLLELLTGD